MATSTPNYGLKKFESGDPPDLPSLAASMDKIDTELKKNADDIDLLNIKQVKLTRTVDGGGSVHLGGTYTGTLINVLSNARGTACNVWQNESGQTYASFYTVATGVFLPLSTSVTFTVISI